MMDRLSELFQLYYNKTATAQQRDELMQLLQQASAEDLRELIMESGQNLDQFDHVLAKDREDQVLRYILGNTVTTAASPAKLRRMNYRKWWAAASIILLLGIGSYFLFFNTKPGAGNLASLPQQERFGNDIEPAKQQVRLTLADGSTKLIDDLSDGSINLSGTEAMKQEGSLTYLQNAQSEILFNTVTTEKGRIFHLKLADGTNVWLDALSSIRFPTSFPSGDRIVEITGQAYFEVAKNPLQPFKVKSSGQVIEVLGTHFNINTYDPENAQTTLLEGSVKVILPQSQSNKEVLLKPGEQAIRSLRSPVTINYSPDLAEVMAWKDGRFRFNGSSVEQIMDQLSRWYNVEVVYKDKINETFVADIERDLPVSRLLTLLEMTRQIKFVIEGNKVTVIKY